MWKSALYLFLPALLLAAGPLSAAKLKFVTVDSGAADLPFVYAVQEGCFAGRGVSVERIPVARGATSVLVSGQADISMSSLGPVLSAYQNGAKLKVLAFVLNRFDYYAVSRYPVTEASRIKTVAINSTGVGGEGILKPFLAYLKLDRSSLKTVMGRGDDVKYAMLEMGYADLFTVSAPEFVRKIAAEGKYYLIPDPTFGRGTDSRVITTTEKVLKKKPQELQDFISGIYCAMKAAAANREKTTALVVKEYGFNAEEASKYFDKYAEAMKDFDYIPSPARIEADWEFVEEVKPAERRPAAGLAFPDFASRASTVPAAGK